MEFPYKIIDLTHALDSSIASWDDGCGFSQDVFLDYDDCEGQDKFRVMKIRMNAGVGTHIDAPSHCIIGGKNIHELSVDELCMPCVVIDIASKSHELYSVTIDDIVAFEDKYGIIKPNSCVMIKTGWEKLWNNPAKYRNNHVFPSVLAEAASLLLARGVRALGIDTLSADRPEDGFKVHQIFLGNNKLLIENVTELEKMPVVGGYVMALPLKIKDGTEAPIRLIGLIKK